MTECYCFLCNAMREIENEETGELKNGRKFVRGKCSECGTAVFKILKIE